MNEEVFKNMSLEEIVDFINEYDTFSPYTNVKLLEIGEGTSKAVMEVKPENLNFMGNIHGGALMTLADTAGGSSIAYLRRLCVTLNSTGNFIRAACPGNVYGYGKLMKIEGNTTVSDVVIKDSQDNIIYKGTVTMFLL